MPILGATPLYVASMNGHFNIVNNADPGHSDVVSMLLKANDDPSIQSNNGVTPLFIASQEKHFSVVSLLPKNNFDPM